jgi:AcrR family transcriptional regulator
VSGRDELLGRAVEWFAVHGVGDVSLRTLAAGLGTSHRMLIYHFGSREGLLSAVVESVERGERETLGRLMADSSDPAEAAAEFWQHVSARAGTFAPLFFELSAAAMQGKPYAASLSAWLVEGWADPLTDLFTRLTADAALARDLAHLCLAAARGLLFEAAVTGERGAADAAMTQLTTMVGAAVAATPVPGAGGGDLDAGPCDNAS